MENKKVVSEGEKVAEALAGFGSFIGGVLNGVVDNAPEGEKAAMKAQVEKVKNGDLKEFNDKMKEFNITLKDLK